MRVAGSTGVASSEKLCSVQRYTHPTSKCGKWKKMHPPQRYIHLLILGPVSITSLGKRQNITFLWQKV